MVVVPTGYTAVSASPSLRDPTSVTPGQLSAAVGTPGFTLAEHWPVALDTVIFAGQVITGACVSLTVIEKLHVEWLLPASVAVQVTTVVPTGKTEPEPGLHEKVAPGKLSVTTGFGYVTRAAHWFASLDLVMPAGQVMLGGWLSVTVTVKLQLAVRPTASVAVQFTVVEPRPKCELEAGVQVAVAPGQLSLTVGWYVTVAVEELGSVPTAILDGQVILGD